MPSVSKKQRNFMAAVAHSPEFAKKVGVPMSVGKEFNQADKGRKFSKGGQTMAKKEQDITKAKMGTVKTAAPSRDGMVTKGHTKGKQVSMKGGKPLGTQTKTMKRGGKC